MFQNMFHRMFHKLLRLRQLPIPQALYPHLQVLQVRCQLSPLHLLSQCLLHRKLPLLHQPFPLPQLHLLCRLCPCRHHLHLHLDVQLGPTRAFLLPALTATHPWLKPGHGFLQQPPPVYLNAIISLKFKSLQASMRRSLTPLAPALFTAMLKFWLLPMPPAGNGKRPAP
jgi:hypothetical protein